MTGVEVLALLLIAALALTQWPQGMFSAALLFINVLLAGLLAFNFFEPLARQLGGGSAGMDRYADLLALSLLFIGFLVTLRLLTRWLAPTDIHFHPAVRQGGGIVFGILTGYILAGILLCMFQTLPLQERFLGYDPDKAMGLGAPDRVWLATVHKASGQVFERHEGEERWFDADGSFIPRYARYRRLDESVRAPSPNQGEFPAVLPFEK